MFSSFLSFESVGEFRPVDLPSSSGRCVGRAGSVEKVDGVVELFQERGGMATDTVESGPGALISMPVEVDNVAAGHFRGVGRSLLVTQDEEIFQLSGDQMRGCGHPGEGSP